MYPSWGGDVSHPERQRDFLGQAVQQGVEGLEGAAVDDQPKPAELGVSALVEADALGGDGFGDTRVPGDGGVTAS